MRTPPSVHRSPPLPVARPRSLAAVLVPLLVLAGLLAGCGDGSEPVAEVSLQPEALTLPYPERREVEVTWEPERPIQPAGAALVFVHLLDAEGEVERTFDHPFPREWRPGQAVTYPIHLYQSMLAPPLPAGEYALTLGLYDADDRWPLAAGPELERKEYQLATVRVPAPQTEALPQLDFVGEWGPLQAGADRQILGSRWLGTEGWIAVQETGRAGRLGLLFDTPATPPGVERVFEGEAEEPCLKVTSTCDDSERRLSGTGLSYLEVEVPAGEPCEIHLQPNFRLDDPDHARRAARLMVVTWNPREG